MNRSIYPLTGVVPAVCDAEAGQQCNSKYKLDQAGSSAGEEFLSADDPLAKTQRRQSFPASHSATFRT
jgi:hypothetical protein